MAKATASPPARRRSGDRPRGKAKTPKHKTTETSQPKHESPRKHEINRGFIAPFLLTRSVHFHAAIWHNLSPPLTARAHQGKMANSNSSFAPFSPRCNDKPCDRGALNFVGDLPRCLAKFRNVHCHSNRRGGDVIERKSGELNAEYERKSVEGCCTASNSVKRKLGHDAMGTHG